MGLHDLPRKPLLEKVSDKPEEAEEPMAAMAQYYLTRFSNSNSSEEERRELAWPHLVRAADLGRQDAEALAQCWDLFASFWRDDGSGLCKMWVLLVHALM